MSVARYLKEIRVIEVQDCQNMKAVIVNEERRDEGMDDTIEFPLLMRLKITSCPIEKFFSYPREKKESAAATSHSQDAYHAYPDSFFDEKVHIPFS